MSFINPECNEIHLSDATRINLKPGDVLMVTIRDGGLDEGSLRSLSQQLKGIFPNNKVAVFGMSPEGYVQFHVASAEPPVLQSYCSNCNCGKKEEAEKQGIKDADQQERKT